MIIYKNTPCVIINKIIFEKHELQYVEVFYKSNKIILMMYITKINDEWQKTYWHDWEHLTSSVLTK